jgi:hypothetical protein
MWLRVSLFPMAQWAQAGFAGRFLAAGWIANASLESSMSPWPESKA